MQVETDILSQQQQLRRTRSPKRERMVKALMNPLQITRELNNRSLYHFMRFFWPEVSNDEFQPNWHIEYLAHELEHVAERVAAGLPKEYDLIVNIPPGTTKTTLVSIMFPVWCWTKWPWMRFITASYSEALSLESAEYSRDMIRSDRFQAVYPELTLKQDKDTKSNFKVAIQHYVSPGHQAQTTYGGNRYSTSVGGTLMGFHGHILIVDDPVNPKQAVSEKLLHTANFWMDQTLSTRKIDKRVTPTILVMQRLHQDDPTGHWITKGKKNVKLISIPGELRNYRKQLHPANLQKYYKNDLLDPVRMNWSVLEDMKADLGQYGYAGQVGQNPTPPGGGMFKVQHIQTLLEPPPSIRVEAVTRYWDKAGTADAGAYTVGVKMAKLRNGTFVVLDVKRGQWSSEERERIIREVAQADGHSVDIYMEQEPGSGGKESAEATIRNLAGWSAHADRPTGDKVYRADPFSVQVNNGNVLVVQAGWNHDYIEELRFFPFGTYKDQVDASAGAFNQLTRKRVARRIT